MKILLAVDGSSYTKKMLAYLAVHDQLLNPASSYTALTVCSALPSRARAALGKEIVVDYYADVANKVLQPVAKFLARKDIVVNSAYKIGSIGESIAKFADSGMFDLVVMGSHGHGSLGNLVMGSVATEVLALSKVPVLLVR